MLSLDVRPLLRELSRVKPPRQVELPIEQELRLPAVRAMVAQLAVDLPALGVAEREPAALLAARVERSAGVQRASGCQNRSRQCLKETEHGVW